MTSQQAITRCFRNWRDFSGRASRCEFWQFFLAVVAFNFCLGWFLNNAVFWVGYGTIWSTITIVAILGVACLAYIPWLAVFTRRLNEVGLPLWISVSLAIAPTVAGILFFSFHEAMIASGFRLLLPVTLLIPMLIAALPPLKTSEQVSHQG